MSYVHFMHRFKMCDSRTWPKYDGSDEDVSGIDERECVCERERVCMRERKGKRAVCVNVRERSM